MHKAVKITITRGEGPTKLCGRPITVTGEKIWSQARSVLWEMSTSAPKEGGYDKVDFDVEFDDGQHWAGTCDIKHYSLIGTIGRKSHEITEEDCDLDIAAHIISFARWEAGLATDPYCGKAQYEELMRLNGEEVQQQYRTFLQEYELWDEDSTPVPSV